MPTYRSSVSIEATVDETFTFLRDVRNVPRFVERVTGAEPEGGEAIQAKVDGVTKTAWFRIHESGHKRRVEWGTEGDGYHGWLEVDREGEVCSVTAEIHAPEVDGEEVDRALWELKAVVEAR